MIKYIDYTAVGQYFVTYLDGVPQSQHTTEREACQRCANLAFSNPYAEVKYIHEYEVNVGLTDAGLTVMRDDGVATDQPPTITSTPNPTLFSYGTASNYEFSDDVSDDGLSALTYSLTNTLPNGLTLNSSTGRLNYDGIANFSTSQHELTVTDAVGSDTSATFDIAIADQPPVINTTPAPTFTEGTASNYEMSQHVTDDGISPLTYSMSGTLADGLTLNASSGQLSYDGVGAVDTSSHTLTVSDAENSDISSSFSVIISSAADADADFLSRVTAAGNIWGHNFSGFVYEGGVVNPARPMNTLNDIETDSNNQGIGPGDALDRETSIYLSGTGSINALTYDTTGSGDGSYNFQQNGQNGTYTDRYYVQFSVYYPRDTLAYRHKSSGSGQMKICNFGNNSNGQFVLAIDRFMNFPAGFVQTASYENFAQWADPGAGHTISSSNGAGWGGGGTNVQNAIDNDPGGPTPTTKAGWGSKHGYVLGWNDSDYDRSYDAGDPWLDLRSHPGGRAWPDPLADVGGVAINMDGWTTFEAFIDRSVGTIQVWAAHYGEAPVKILEEIDHGAMVTSSKNEHYLLNYDTPRQSEVGRPSPQNTYYDELIVSTNPIKFPGGYFLPGNLGGVSELSQLAAGLSAGGAVDYPGGAMPDAQAWINGAQGIMDWAALFHHDPDRAVLHGFGKVNDSAGRHSRHYIFDESTGVWDTSEDPIGHPLGHPYYCHNLDLSNGDFYIQAWSEDYFHRYTQSTGLWDYNTSSDIYNWQNSPPVASALHPTLFPAKTDKRGFVVWALAPLYAYSLEDEVSVELSPNINSVPDGSNPPCVYCPGMDAVVFGVGPLPNQMYKVEPGDPPTYTEIANGPVRTQPNGNYSILAVHPVTGMPMILQRSIGAGSLVWNYDPVADQWNQNDTHPFGALTAEQFIVCTMPAYGVMSALYMKNTGAHDYDLGFHIWRPTV